MGVHGIGGGFNRRQPAEGVGLIEGLDVKHLTFAGYWIHWVPPLFLSRPVDISHRHRAAALVLLGIHG